MVAKLNPDDLLFLQDQVLFGATPPPGTDPFSLEGLRSIDGTSNNLTHVTIVDQYGNLVDTDTFANVDQPFFFISTTPSSTAYTPNTSPVDSSPRIISNLIADAVAATNPAVTAEATGNPGDPTVDILPFNTFFTFFGQFFDHGLDLINKGGNGVVVIPLLPTDQLWVDPASPEFIPGASNMMFVNRATLDGSGNTTNADAPLVEQSQTYGSRESTTFYLMEYDINGIATGRLVTGADGGMATWADIKANALRWAEAQPGAIAITEMLNDTHIPSIPDPTFWDPTTGTFLPGSETGQAFLVDIAHTANPQNSMGAFLTADIDTDLGNHPAPGFYDNELLDAHFIAGDPRANENTVLMSIHEVFHNEHNRLVLQIEDWIGQQDQIQPGFAAQWSGEQVFQAAKLINEMQYQHMVFEEFARRVSPNITAFAQYQVELNPNISMEFSQAVYRLGHSMLTDTVSMTNAAGQDSSLTLIEAFLNPLAFDAAGGGADFIKGAQQQQGNQIDEFVVDALRNFLVGLPLDLAAINIARGRDVGLPTLNQVRADLFAQTGEASLAAYTSWDDFAANLLNPGSLVNFIAAYATATNEGGNDVHGAGIEAARLAGDNDLARSLAADAMADAAFMGATGDQGFNLIDLWIGGLAEQKVLGDAVSPGMLGSTFDFIFATQLRALQDADRLYYLARLGGTNILVQIEGQTFADLVMRATGAEHLNGDAFGTADTHVEISTLGLMDFVKSPAELAAVVHEVIGGDNFANILMGGAGNDSIWGDGGDDTIAGGIGNDHLYGGDGNDTITDSGGDDFIRGDAGNDILNGGIGVDAVSGGTGNDTIMGGQGADELFGNEGNDIIFGGDQDDGLEGGEGDDVLHGGAGDDGLDGERGNDVLIGDAGDDFLVGGEDDDFLIGGAGADTLDGGVGGYDVASYENSPFGLTIDMVPNPAATGDARGDVYADIEAVRGTGFADQMFGDALDNVLEGGAGNDAINGRDGADTLMGMEGNDTLVGGLGEDLALFRGVRAEFTIAPGLGGITVTDGNLIDPGIDEGVDFVADDVEFLLFDDQLLSTADFITTAPLISLSNTVERTQSGLPGGFGANIIGEALSTVPVNDGTALTGQGINLGAIIVDDPDGIIDGARVFTLTGADAASFSVLTVDGAPTLFLTGGGTLSSTNYEVKPAYHVTVNVADGSGGSAINLTLNITDVNDNAPVVGSGAHVNVQEQTPTNVVVYRAHATDLDSTADPLTYSLTGAGADDALFTMINGEVRFNSVPDFAAPLDTGGDNVYNIQIGVSDGLNPQVTKDVTIQVTDTGTPPAFTSTPAAPILVAENTLAAEILYDADATDVDLTPLTYVLSGPDAALFTIDPVTGELRFNTAPDFETPMDANGDNLYEISVGASDGFYTTLQTANVQVTNIVGNTIVGTALADTVNAVVTVLGQPFVTSEEDTIIGNAGVDRINGIAGNDMILGGLDGDKLYGGLGNDMIQGDGGDDLLVGEAGNDMLDGGTENDFIIGGLGNDTLLGGDGNDKLIGASDTDAEGADFLDGGLGNDQLFADASDTVQGGAGTDFLVAKGTTGLNVDVAAASIEETRGGDFGDVFDASGLLGGVDFVRLRGNGGDDTLIGGDGADKLYGGDHNDLLQGNAGADFLVGGNGNDMLEGGAGADKLVGDAGNDTLLGGADNDKLISATGADAEGADILDGGAGNDWLFADASDTIQGGTGNDLLSVNGPTGITLDLAVASIEETRGSAFTDVFDGSGVTASILRLRGNAGDDTLIGGSQGDKLYGGLDNDLLQGNAGADFLVGNEGIDTLIGGAGADVLVGGTEADMFWATGFDGLTDQITDYNFAVDGDSVQGLSFTVVGLDTLVWDGLAGTGNNTFVLTGYDATASGINLFA